MEKNVAEYEFEELCPQIDGYHVDGMMLFGTAELVSSDPISEPHEFYVRKVVLAGGLTLQSKMVPNGHTSHREWLFEAIKSVLESGRTAHGKAAQIKFNEQVQPPTDPDPDLEDEDRYYHPIAPHQKQFTRHTASEVQL